MSIRLATNQKKRSQNFGFLSTCKVPLRIYARLYEDHRQPASTLQQCPRTHSMFRNYDTIYLLRSTPHIHIQTEFMDADDV